MQYRLLLFLCSSALLACSSGDIGGPKQPPGPAPTNPGPGGGETPTPPPYTPPAADAAPPPSTPSDAAPVQPPAASPDAANPPSAPPGGPRGPFTCTLVIGISATGDWFKAGFEGVVGNERWELMAVHSGFVNYWADLNHSIWGTKPSSACAMNAGNPDRVVLSALYLHWMDATVDEWVTALNGAIKNFKTKYSNLKNVELTTFVRSPDEKPCPASMPFKSYIRPEQDMAYLKVAAMFPDLVTVAPKTEVRTCADYGGNPPHLTGGGASAAAQTLGAIYK
jgi:hypothetical protein